MVVVIVLVAALAMPTVAVAQRKKATTRDALITVGIQLIAKELDKKAAKGGNNAAQAATADANPQLPDITGKAVAAPERMSAEKTALINTLIQTAGWETGYTYSQLDRLGRDASRAYANEYVDQASLPQQGSRKLAAYTIDVSYRYARSQRDLDAILGASIGRTLTGNRNAVQFDREKVQVVATYAFKDASGGFGGSIVSYGEASRTKNVRIQNGRTVYGTRTIGIQELRLAALRNAAMNAAALYATIQIDG